MATEVGLVYRGKKAPLTIENVRYTGKKFVFHDPQTTVWVPKSDADILTRENPAMFANIGERQTEPGEPVGVQEEIKTIAETEPPSNLNPPDPEVKLPRPTPSIVKDNIRETDEAYKKRFDLDKFQLETLGKRRFKEDLDRRWNQDKIIGRLEWLESKRLEKIEEDGNVFQGR